MADPGSAFGGEFQTDTELDAADDGFRDVRIEAADEGLRFPENAGDALQYLGNLEPLGLSEEEQVVVRHWTEELVEERGERAVWNSRLRLKLELRYLISEAGLQKRTGRS